MPYPEKYNSPKKVTHLCLTPIHAVCYTIVGLRITYILYIGEGRKPRQRDGENVYLFLGSTIKTYHEQFSVPLAN